jgi:hypothetical protein
VQSDPDRQKVFCGLFHVPVRIVHALVVKFRRQLFPDKIKDQARCKVADIFVPFF